MLAFPDPDMGLLCGPIITDITDIHMNTSTLEAIYDDPNFTEELQTQKSQQPRLNALYYAINTLDLI